MKAMVIVPGKMEERWILGKSKPDPQPNEILMKVKATAVNRADLYQLKGAYPVQKTSGDP
jgi:NADPH:quinone reductase-like Zn-dependent oxidoreductase